MEGAVRKKTEKEIHTGKNTDSSLSPVILVVTFVYVQTGVRSLKGK